VADEAEGTERGADEPALELEFGGLAQDLDVNANFDAVEVAGSDNDTPINAAQSTADAAAGTGIGHSSCLLTQRPSMGVMLNP
jgi:hypothetical protein